MTQGQNQDVVSMVCDKIRFGAFCLMVFFLPVASSFIEVTFGIIILTYIVQRTRAFYILYLREAFHHKLFSWKKFKEGFIKSYKPVDTPLNQAIGYYMLIAFLSIFVSYYPGLTLKAFVFQMAQATFTYFLFVETVKTRKRFGILLWFLLGSVTLVSANGIFQYFARVEYIRQHPITDGRVTSTFGHANNLAGYLIAVLPVIFSLSSLNHWFHKQFQVTDKAWGKITSTVAGHAFLFVFVLGAICLGLTYSRGPILIFALSLVFFVIRKPKYLVFMLCVGALFTAIFFGKMYQERTTNIFDQAEGKIGLAKRLVFWEEALMIIEDHPILGVGFNNYSMIGRLYKINWGGYPHNGYLHIAAEIGVFGLAAFLWIWARFFKAIHKSYIKFYEGFSGKLILGLVIGLGVFLIYSFFDTNFHDDRLETLMWLVLGMAMSLINILTNSSDRKLQS